MDNLQIREMTIEDYDEIFALWQVTTKRALSDADSRENIAKYLEHNKGMSLVGIVDGKIVATVLVTGISSTDIDLPSNQAINRLNPANN